MDGGIGSLLHQRGFLPDEHLWTSSAVITAPQLTANIHKEYAAAGADIITTNTFRTNPEAAAKSNFEFTSKQLVDEAVRLAKEAAGGYDVLIAGANAPAEDCYQREVTLAKDKIYDNHCGHIDNLIEAGVDVILNETQSHLEEIEIICKICSAGDFPFVVSLFFDENLRLLSGESVQEAAQIVRSYSPDLICFNCVKPESFMKLFEIINFDFEWGFYLNCGLGKISDDKIEECLSPSAYLEITKNFMNDNLKMIGSCCGSSPAHTKVIRKYLDELVKS